VREREAPEPAPTRWKRAYYRTAIDRYNRCLKTYKGYHEGTVPEGELEKAIADLRLAIEGFKRIKDTAPRSVDIDGHLRDCYFLLHNIRKDLPVD
jgi:hypothetical protein